MASALPLQDSGRAPAAPAAPRRPRVLVVDDSALARGLLETALAAQGFEVQGVGEGATALRLLAGGGIDLVILETAMHGPPEVPLLRAIRGDPRAAQVPVIVLTDRADRESVLAAVGLRVSGYLLKGQFKMEALLERVRLTLSAASAAPARAPGVQARGRPLSRAAAAASPGRPVTTPPAASSPEAAPAAAAPAEALRSVKPLLTRSAMEDKLKRCEDVRAFSPSVSRVLKLTSSQEVCMDAVVAAVSQDHAIALKLLKLANSAAFSTGEPVDSVKKAVLRMGLDKIRQAVMSIGVVERYSTAVFTERFNFAHFWEHSIACGLIAAELARAVGGIEPDNAFAMGLLHDVGRVALIEHMPAEYAQVLEAAERLGLPLELLEPRMLLVSHSDIMDRLLRAWRFPRDLMDPITLHHAGAGGVRGAAAARAAEVGVLALANRLAHAMLLGGSGNEVIYPAGDLIGQLKIDAAVIARLESSIPEETAKIKLSMLSVASGENWPQVRDRYRAALRGPFRPLFVAPDAPRDPLRIFCGALAEEPTGQSPTVAVAHLPDPRAAQPTGALLRAAEAEAGVGGLPLLVLSPGAKLNLDEGTLAGRTTLTLPTPVSIAAFTAAVNRAMGAAQ